ncbi:MAG: GNAT family N-acetyltransferase [Bryobacterales bacterium]|nr:GNAT family N-acetyltransferase [Bryobacterales bacterium]
MLNATRESGLEIFELPQFRLAEMAPLLEEEVSAWRDTLYWDYTTSSTLIGQFIDSRALNGMVLHNEAGAIGYTYFVCEDRKALLGCLFVSESFRNLENEQWLLETTLEAIRRRPGIRRVEAQLMLHPFPSSPQPLPAHLEVHERLFMSAPASERVPTEQPMPEGLALRVEPWNERYQDRAAYLIENAYRGHLDSQINDQYQTAEGARRFLYNIIQYPGCGRFSYDSSFLAIETGSGSLMAACLASIVSDGVGHITQVCTHPKARGYHLGEHLIERTMSRLAAAGCHHITLTVTAANSGAVRLYQRLGFSVLHHFPAYVWKNL